MVTWWSFDTEESLGRSWNDVVARGLLAPLGGARRGRRRHHRSSAHHSEGVLSAQRTQRVAFLLDAYRKLIDASERSRISSERRDNLESAFADIMLLGGPEEIAAANRFQVQFVRDLEGSLDPVINALRDSLRRELGIAATSLPSPYNLRLTLDEDAVKFRFNV